MSQPVETQMISHSNAVWHNNQAMKLLYDTR